MRGRALLILCALIPLSAPARAQGGLVDMSDPFTVAERASSCLSAYRQGGVPGRNALVKSWSRALLFAGAWAAQYGYSLRDLHLANSADTFGCEDDIKKISEKFGDVIAKTYKKTWEAARAKNKNSAPALEEPGLKALSQAAWCAQALSTGAQALQDSPADFGFNTSDAQGQADLDKATGLSRANARLWEDRLAALAPPGSTSANMAAQARAAFLSWDADLSAQKDPSFRVNFLTNETSPCNTLGSALGAPAND